MSNQTEIQPIALSMRQVVARIGLCRSTIEKLIAQKRFPAPKRVGAKLLFDRARVDKWWADWKGDTGAEG